MKAPEEVNARENERFEKIRKNMAKVDAKLQAEKDLLDGDDDEDDSDDKAKQRSETETQQMIKTTTTTITIKIKKTCTPNAL